MVVATATEAPRRQFNRELLDDYKRTSLGWQSQYLKIVDKKSQLVPLVHNVAQLKVHNAIALQRKHNLPIMLVVLKARQEGISTFIEACIFEDINRKPNVHGSIVSMDKVSTDKVFRMCETFQQEMPKDLVLLTDRASAKEIRYSPPHRSSMLCQTAGTKTLGRGGTTQKVHATEVAFWANADTQLLGLLQEVPNEPDTMVVLESTANGVGGAFYKHYWDAVERLRRDPHDYTGYLPVFLSWQDFPEYQKTLPQGCTTVPNMTPEMEEYVKEGLAMDVVLSPEQIYFALQTVQNKCGNDISRFKAEYPRTAREAFQSTGRAVFKPIDLDVLAKNCRPPAATIEFYEGDGGKVKYRHVNRKENCWSVWKWPVKHHSYVGFGDVAEGMLSDPNDAKSDPDRSVAAILDRNHFEVPMTYYGRPDTIDFAEQFILGCKYFNYAWASPEMNSIGQSILDAMKKADYPYIYSREYKEEEVQREDSKKLGWRTTQLTKKPMIADLQTVSREHELGVFDIRFIEEMRVYVWGPDGKPRAEIGEKDDCVITLAGLVQLHQRCPLNEDLSWDRSDEKPERPIAVMGAMDVDDEGEDPDGLDLLYEDMSDYE